MEMDEITQNNQPTGLEVAVIGMAGRFPAAKNIDQFWENLKNGVDAITFFTEEELSEAGADPKLLENPSYVKASGILEDIEYFDASFFDYSPREGEIMDPQLRIFHEVCWHALENAGYDPDQYRGLIGMFAGANSNPTWFFRHAIDPNASADLLSISNLSDTYAFCTRISYKMNLKGPSVTVQCACSTSLVAIHMAVRGLLCGECDMALAGGVSIVSLEKEGYLFQQGMILSPDGHCRAFDARAEGTIFGDGVGVVVLKRLDDALADRDTIHAVIKGSATNNDGKQKVGYMAPSMKGQADVVAAAYRLARVDPQTIGYIETHGTGTSMGDPIEISSLKRSFNSGKNPGCRIGSVKTNVGHLNNAAGVSGFIKTVLALKHRLIPPTLHYEAPNPEIDFENSPFVVNKELYEWKRNGGPLRAGVSSIGGGGTNAHVILEEWPMAQDAERKAQAQGREYQLILLSGKTQTALDKATENFAEFLKKNPGINFADAAYTLQVGRKHFQHRRMLVCATRDEAVEVISTPGSGKVFTLSVNTKENKRKVVFMFPGQGSQYVNMGWGLYQGESVFREEMDRCFDIYQSLTGCDIKEILYPEHTPALTGHPSQEGSVGARGGSLCPPKDCVGSPGQGHHRDPTTEPLQSARPSGPVDSPLERGAPDPRKGRGVSKPATSADKINQTEISQPVIFIFEYALAKLLISWGIQPTVMIGYSFGEYAAACISGVFSLEHALKLVVLRGQLMQEMPKGGMLSVPVPLEKITPLLNDQLSIAIDNGPSCIVSGTVAAIDEFEKIMKEKRWLCTRVSVTHAGHSDVMEPVLLEFEKEVGKMELKEPQIPYISNVTGTGISSAEATDPHYWVKHLKDTVRYGEGQKELLSIPNAVFVEVGPGRDLSVLLKSQPCYKPELPAINLVRHENEQAPDIYYLFNRLGHLWLHGVNMDWHGFHREEKRCRIPLPTYPFDRQYFKMKSLVLETGKIPGGIIERKQDTDQWLYVPLWMRSPIHRNLEIFADHKRKTMLVFPDEGGLGNQIKKQLCQQGFQVFTAHIGERFTRLNHDEFAIKPTEIADYERLFNEITASAALPATILHLWSVAPPTARMAAEKGDEVEKELDRGFYSLIALAQALGKQDPDNHFQIKVVTNHVQDVVGGDVKCPEKATLIGPTRVIVQEYSYIDCCMIDIDLPEPGSRQEQQLVNRLLEEFKIKIQDRMIAYRDDYRWVETFQPLEVEKSVEPDNQTLGLREEGVYLVTGGVGGIGLILARHLAQRVRAKLILTGRSTFPERDQWDYWLSTHNREEKISRRIREIREIEALGAEVLVSSADVSQFEQMQQVIRRAIQRFGKINGVIHAAGIPDGAMIVRRTREMSEEILAPKVMGTLVLDQLFEDADLDFLIFCSSTSSVFPMGGQIAYSAANAFLDTFAVSNCVTCSKNPISIIWERWKNVGVALIAEEQHKDIWGVELEGGITPSEGTAVFNRILSQPLPRLLTCPVDLAFLLREYKKTKGTPYGDIYKAESRPQVIHPRPELSVEYVEPSTEMEQKLADVWQNFMGLDKVGIHDNFFELGVTSLGIIQVNGRLNNELGKDIPVVTMYSYPTVALLAKFLNQAKGGDDFIDKEQRAFESIDIGQEKKKNLRMRRREVQ